MSERDLDNLYAQLHWADEQFDMISPNLMPDKKYRKRYKEQAQSKIDCLKKRIKVYESRKIKETVC